jgi:hypothetical protein
MMSWHNEDGYRESALLTARHFIPLMTLLVEDYRLDMSIKVDPESNEHTVFSPSIFKRSLSQTITDTEPDFSRPLGGNEQVRCINRHTFSSGKKASVYYLHNISLLLNIPPPFDVYIDELPVHQYKLTQMSDLMDKIGEILEHHRDWLHNTAFQESLMRKLALVQSHYDVFKTYVESSRSLLQKGEHIALIRNIVLQDMAVQLEKNITMVKLLMADLTLVVSSYHFSQTQKEEIDNAIRVLESYSQSTVEASPSLNVDIKRSSLSSPQLEKNEDKQSPGSTPTRDKQQDTTEDKIPFRNVTLSKGQKSFTLFSAISEKDLSGDESKEVVGLESKEEEKEEDAPQASLLEHFFSHLTPSNPFA